MPSSLTLVTGAPQARNINIGLHSPIVRVLKADGTPYASTQVKWLFPTTPGAPSGVFGFGSNPQNTTTDANGLASLPNLSATNGVTGAWNITASLVAEPSVTLLIPITNTNDSTVVFGLVYLEQGNFQSKPVNTVYPTDLRFNVYNTQAGAIPSYQMRIRKISPTPADFKVEGVTTTLQSKYTDAAGRLTLDIESGATVGTAKIQCDRASGSFYGASATATLTIYALTPASIQLNSGNNQSVNISTAFPLPMKAKVVDSGGAAVPGTTVTFTIASGYALFSNASNVCSAVTDASGIATSLAFTASALPGTWSCAATVASPALSNSFTQSNIGTGDKAQDPMQYCET